MYRFKGYFKIPTTEAFDDEVCIEWKMIPEHTLVALKRSVLGYSLTKIFGVQ